MPITAGDLSTAAAAMSGGDSSATTMRPTLGMPRGSIRALLALCVAGTTYWLLANPGMLASGALPHDLLGALLLILGYYFADRASTANLAPDAGPYPLWLPKGSVRTMLIGGFFASVAYLLYSQRPTNFFELAAAPVIVQVGSFILGRLGKAIIKGFFNQGKTKTATIIGDIKGLVGIAAGVGTVLVYCFPTVLPAEVTAKFVELFPSVISFYFGSR